VDLGTAVRVCIPFTAVFVINELPTVGFDAEISFTTGIYVATGPLQQLTDWVSET